MKRYNLNKLKVKTLKTILLKKFTCVAKYPYEDFIGKSVETDCELKGQTSPISVSVPESIYTALEKEKYIKNPYKGMNAVEAEWVADRWWTYETAFESSVEHNCEIVFESVDYICHIYLNGKIIATHVGASAGFSVDISGKLNIGKNILRVLVENSPYEFGQVGISRKVNTQRPQFDNFWDFCTKLKNIGIYRPCFVHFYDYAKLEFISFRTKDYKTKRCVIFCETKCDGGKYKVKFVISKADKILYEETLPFNFKKGKNKFSIERIFDKLRLWNINGSGMPNIYDLSVSIISDNKVCDEKKQIVGVRNIRLDKNFGADFEHRGYTFVVNGKRIFARGFNITPLKQLLGSETEQDYIKLVKAAKDAHANIIRVWGGGIIEQPLFYRLCSENGIMIWQDITQSSRGLFPNNPSESPKFLKLLKQTTQYLLEQRGAYPALAVICGGNELFGKDGRPITLENKNPKIIFNTIKQFAPDLEFITSTSSGPVQTGDLINYKNNHDIHGPWLYEGNSFFSYYNQLKTLYVGEFGTNGMCSLSSLHKFLDKKDIGVFTTENNYVWRKHGAWWDSATQMKRWFGENYTLKEINIVSRYIQNFALLYAIGTLRRAAPYTSGCMVWQLNEMYPCVYSTSLIDFYGRKKPGYYSVKRAYDSILPSFKFQRVDYNNGEKFLVECYITADRPKEIEVELVMSDGEKQNKKVIFKGEVYETMPIYKSEYTMSGKYVLITLNVTAENILFRADALFLNRKGEFCDKSAISVMETLNKLK